MIKDERIKNVKCFCRGLNNIGFSYEGKACMRIENNLFSEAAIAESTAI
jgi:hypothetical protein